MTERMHDDRTGGDLRRRAKAQLESRTAASAVPLSNADVVRLVHELQVHQIELQMQNDELRQTQAQLDAARECYFDLYNLAPVGYCTLSEDGVILEGNLAAGALLSMPRGALAGQRMDRFVHVDDRELFHAHHRHLLKTGEPQTCELRMTRQDGSAFHGHVTATAARASDASSVCRLILSDITGRKQAEEALRQKNEELERYFNASLDLLCITDAEGCFRKLNPEWTRTFGYSMRDLEGQPILSFVHPEDHEATRRAILQRMGPNAGETFVNRCRHHDGSYRWLEWRSHHVGSMVHAVARDVTERRSLEDRLRQREKMDAIGQLAGGIAHDFNNQLAAIATCSEILISRLGDTALMHHARLILSTAHKAADLTGQLLAFSHKGKFLSVPVAMNAVVNEVIALLRRSIDKRITVKAHLSDELPNVLGDPAQLQNMLLNLALNARDAMMSNGGTLSISTRIVDLVAQPGEGEPAAGRYLELCVTDTGHGMTAEVKKHLFEPFFTTKEIGKGTGLGLASIFGTVRNHGGTIRVSSEPDKGASFRIWLPLLPDSEGPSEAPHKEIAPASGGLRNLVIDDEQNRLEATGAILESNGFVVTCFSSSVEAVAHYTRTYQNFDLVLLDMAMPDMGGREAFGLMKKANPTIKAILASGYGLNGEAQQMLNDGVAGFIQKPYRFTELSAVIQKALA